MYWWGWLALWIMLGHALGLLYNILAVVGRNAKGESISDKNENKEYWFLNQAAFLEKERNFPFLWKYSLRKGKSEITRTFPSPKTPFLVFDAIRWIRVPTFQYFYNLIILTLSTFWVIIKYNNDKKI